MTKQPLVSAQVRKRLRALYDTPDRHYHGMTHIEAMLALLDANRGAFSDPEAVEAAIWFHDAIYDSRRSDNEERSAELARETLNRSVEEARLARILAMIRATAGHLVPELSPETAKHDAALFLDIDLSILGAPAAAFDAYEAAVRREYAWVEDHAWRSGRTKVLLSFLDRPAIFHTARFANLYEARARDNITRSLAALA